MKLFYYFEVIEHFEDDLKIIFKDLIFFFQQKNHKNGVSDLLKKT